MHHVNGWGHGDMERLGAGCAMGPEERRTRLLTTTCLNSSGSRRLPCWSCSCCCAAMGGSVLSPFADRVGLSKALQILMKAGFSVESFDPFPSNIGARIVERLRKEVGSVAGTRRQAARAGRWRRRQVVGIHGCRQRQRREWSGGSRILPLHDAAHVLVVSHPSGESH